MARTTIGERRISALTSQEVAEPSNEQDVTVRYWAAAKAAIGFGEEKITLDAPVTVAHVRAAVTTRHPQAERVIGVCSVLVADQPAGSADGTTTVVPSGAVVEFLPPFAGG